MVTQRVNRSQEALPNENEINDQVSSASLWVKFIMTPLNDNEELAKAKYEIERATIDCAELSLIIGDELVATLARDNFEFSVEWGKLIFAWWNEGASQSWRVTAYEIDRKSVV